MVSQAPQQRWSQERARSAVEEVIESFMRRGVRMKKKKNCSLIKAIAVPPGLASKPLLEETGETG